MAIHVYGTPRLITEREPLLAIVSRLAALHDPKYANGEFRNLTETYLNSMLGRIVGFEIDVSKIESRFKLSQDKTPGERARVAASLAAEGSDNSREIAHLMLIHGPHDTSSPHSDDDEHPSSSSSSASTSSTTPQ